MHSWHGHGADGEAITKERGKPCCFAVDRFLQHRQWDRGTTRRIGVILVLVVRSKKTRIMHSSQNTTSSFVETRLQQVHPAGANSLTRIRQAEERTRKCSTGAGEAWNLISIPLHQTEK